MVLKPPGAAQTPKTDPTKSGRTAFRYPADFERQKHDFFELGVARSRGAPHSGGAGGGSLALKYP